MKRYYYAIVVVSALYLSMNTYCEKFEPDWESLKQYKTPEWNVDAKFGIFIHWGAYSVSAYGNEWYPRNMYQPENKIFTHHKETWGDQSEFGYKDFIPKFDAEKWNPDEWAELFEKSGAKYVVPVAEHHDGFAMYDSSQTKWNSANMGPKRDVCGELAKAVRKRGMKFGVSSHYAWNWRYYNIQDEFDNSDPEFEGLYGIRHNSNAPASDAFISHWFLRTRELIDKYQPDLLWFDFGFCYPEFEPKRREIAAYFYNKGIDWGKGVVLNYKRWTKPQDGVTKVAFPDGAGTLDLEREKSPRIREFFWQTDTSISKKSWGYIENDEYKSPDSLVDDLVDIVSKNGCLLLNIGPRSNGTIPQQARDILLSIGDWLQVNGEALYNTRPWKVYGEGPTGVAEGHLSENKNKPFTAEDIRFTQKGDVIYAIALEWPLGGVLKIKSLSKSNILLSSIKSIEMIGSDQKIEWIQDNEGLSVQLPENQPCKFAYVLKIVK